MYTPYFAKDINMSEGTTFPVSIKAYNNKAFDYWVRSLMQRLFSRVEADLPDDWDSTQIDFFKYTIIRYGFLTFFNHNKYGNIFQPCDLYGRNLYYMPTHCLVSNPAFKETLRLEIGKDCALLRLTPDFMGLYDIICYYAEKLASLDSAINMSIVNNKFAYVLFGKNKACAQAIRKILDKINRGEPSVIADQRLMNDEASKDTPFQFLERPNLKQSYITDLQLQDMQTILNSFDSEIGIQNTPYEKKERLVTDEIEVNKIDSSARLSVWINCLNESAKDVNRMFGLNLRFRPRTEGGNDNGNNENDPNRDRKLSE